MCSSGGILFGKIAGVYGLSDRYMADRIPLPLPGFTAFAHFDLVLANEKVYSGDGARYPAVVSKTLDVVAVDTETNDLPLNFKFACACDFRHGC